ncbi:unnamed protein product [Chrysoparadoxa australica]
MMTPLNPLVKPLLTDAYQLTMAYAYWKAGRANESAVFDLFFRKCPFKGEYTVFAGLQEALSLIRAFSFSEEDVAYIRSALLPHAEDAFFSWLSSLDCRDLKVYAIKEGTLVFPRVPLLRIEGPLGVGQLLETVLLNAINYATLICTNAARFRLRVGWEKSLLEFGLRRAQGPDGALSASRYSYMGTFDATSNCLAGQLLDIPVRGTHAHAFVQSYTSLSQIGEDGQDLLTRTLRYREAKAKKKKTPVTCYLETLIYDSFMILIFLPLLPQLLDYTTTNTGELAAFVAYATAFPDSFLALVDSYDTLVSGVPNFICVALALDDMGKKPLGIRLDSGDLAYLSKQARAVMRDVGSSQARPWLQKVRIVASNDINEKVLEALNSQGHEIDTFGVGTHLVTCQAQPALGCVFKLVEIEGAPRIKVSQSLGKITIPGRKEAYRLLDAQGQPLLDLMLRATDPAPKPGVPILCRHPFVSTKRVYATPTKVQTLLEKVWDGECIGDQPSMLHIRERVKEQLQFLRPDVSRTVNPTPYKVRWTYLTRLDQTRPSSLDSICSCSSQQPAARGVLLMYLLT